MVAKINMRHFALDRLSALFISLSVSLLLTTVSPQAAAACAESAGASVKTEGGQVLDQSNGSTWQRCLVGKTWDEASARCTGTARHMTRDAAVDYVKGLKPTADGTWRLPTPVELMTLIDFRCRGSNRRLKWFGDPDAKVLWSSEIYRPTPDYAWGLSAETAELIYQLRMDEFQLLLIRANK